MPHNPPCLISNNLYIAQVKNQEIIKNQAIIGTCNGIGKGKYLLI